VTQDLACSGEIGQRDPAASGSNESAYAPTADIGADIADGSDVPLTDYPRDASQVPFFTSC